MADPNNNILWQVLQKLAVPAGQSLANALSQRGNSAAFEASQNAQRQSQAEAFQNYWNEQNAARADPASEAESQQRDFLNQLNLAKGGFTRTPTGGTSDVSLGGVGYSAPTPEATFSIKADSDLGKFLQTPNDITGLTGLQYITASQNFALHNQAAKDDQLAQAALTQEKAAAHQWVNTRLTPQYSTGLYGAPDPTLDSERKALHNQIDATPDLKGMEGFWGKTRNYETPGETELRKKKELTDSLKLKAGELNNVGTWQMVEDTDGNPKLMNTKTGQIRDVQGIQKSGTAAKLKAPLDAVQSSLDYAQSYLKGGQFTGPGDEALMEKFFDLAKPSTGFRMTQSQMEMAQRSRSWMGGLEAKAHHALTGTWFSDEQRQQLVQTMNQLGQAKMATLKRSNGQTQQTTFEAPPANRPPLTSFWSQ